MFTKFIYWLAALSFLGILGFSQIDSSMGIKLAVFSCWTLLLSIILFAFHFISGLLVTMWNEEDDDRDDDDPIGDLIERFTHHNKR